MQQKVAQEGVLDLSILNRIRELTTRQCEAGIAESRGATANALDEEIVEHLCAQ